MSGRVRIGISVLLLLIFTVTMMTGCRQQTTLLLSSSAFNELRDIPIMYTCDGENISPPLNWSELPAGTQTLALIMEDPDAPVEGGLAPNDFTHWVIYNIPASVSDLTEGITNQAQLDNGAFQGQNDLGTIGYVGPCPPDGPPHHYRFTLYAVNTVLNITGSGATKHDVLTEIYGHVLGQVQLTGLYQH